MQGRDGKPWGLVDRSFAFSVMIVKLCRRLDSTPGVPRRLSGQLFDARTSIGANIREGQAAQSRADFITKYTIALKESNETDYWLSLVIAADLLPDSEVAGTLGEVR